MNHITLLGRLTKDCEVRYTSTGKVVCQFTLAVDRPFTNHDGQREADFINIVVWGKIAEICGNSLQKGHRVLVDGRLQIRSYEGKGGVKKYITEVIASSVEFIERKGYQPGASSQEPMATFAPERANMESFGTVQQGGIDFDEEIPF